MGKMYAGTSGWAYSSWRPGFYPAKLSAALCVAEDAELATPEVVTANFCYLRLRKKRYSRKAPAERARRLATNGDVFVYFKHEETAEGALRAEALLRAVRHQRASV